MKCTCALFIASAYLQCDSTDQPLKYTNVQASFTRSDACITVSAASTSYDGALSECNSKHCPYCWRLDTSSNAVTVTFTRCSYYMGADYSSEGMTRWEFMNTGANNAFVADGATIYTLAPYGTGGSVATCFCNSNVFTCSVPTVRGASQSPAVGIAVMPEALSVKDQVNLASSLSVRSFTKFGAYLRLNAQELQLNTDAATYIKYDSGVQFYVSSNRALSLGSASGTLHGTWSSDGIVTTSDARLKREIEPLRRTLRKLQQGSRPKARVSEEDVLGKDDVEPIMWLLSQLQPVSYIHAHDKTGGRRFGFLAHELERVLPDMIRYDGDAARTKRVYLMDLVAVLVAAVQHQQDRVQIVETKAGQCQNVTRALEDKVSKLELALERMSARLDNVSSCCSS